MGADQTPLLVIPIPYVPLTISIHTLVSIASVWLLALMLAQRQPGIKITAIEVDEQAASQAHQNFADSPWADRLTVINNRIQDTDLSKNYDIVVSNPPFYEKELLSPNGKRNIAHHNEGLLLSELPGIIIKTLKPEGNFFLMVPYKRFKEIENLFSISQLAIEKLVFVKQSRSHDYFRFFIKGSLNKAIVCERTEISIREHDNREYTEEFKNLLKDYYLKLN